MENPFVDIHPKAEIEIDETVEGLQQKQAKRDAIYAQYDPMVNEILEMFILTHRQGIWEKDSDCARRYCCHVAWFAGPREKYHDPYDIHHTLRRRLEITLEMDGLCNTTGFKVTNYEGIVKTVHVGLEKDDLVRGIKAIMV